MMTLLFGLMFGPMLTLAAASMLAVAGFTNADFATVGWRRLAGFTALACAAGMAIGFAIGAVVGPSGAITFMVALIGGIVGALIPTSVLVGRAAKQRAGTYPL
jgi:Trk-type K+ transport system membrane component